MYSVCLQVHWDNFYLWFLSDKKLLWYHLNEEKLTRVGFEPTTSGFVWWLQTVQVFCEFKHWDMLKVCNFVFFTHQSNAHGNPSFKMLTYIRDFNCSKVETCKKHSQVWKQYMPIRWKHGCLFFPQVCLMKCFRVPEGCVRNTLWEFLMKCSLPQIKTNW